MRYSIKGRWQPVHQWESFHWSIIYTVFDSVLVSSLVLQEFMENECEALPGVAYPGVRDNRSTINTKTGYDDDDDDDELVDLSAVKKDIWTSRRCLFADTQIRLSVITWRIWLAKNMCGSKTKINTCERPGSVKTSSNCCCCCCCCDHHDYY